MAVIRISVGQSAKVTNPLDRYENATFNETLTFEREWAEPPDTDDPEMIAAYEAARDEEIARIRKNLVKQVDKSLEAQIKEFNDLNTKKDNE
jgi:hypothetical protein